MDLSPQALRLLSDQTNKIHLRCNLMFAWLFGIQWLAMIAAALIISPRTWIGATSYVHVHVWAAIVLGEVIISFPMVLISYRPYSTITRHVVAVAQMLCSAMLIHLTGGRVETHFHIFGSLAFLAFYRDWRVLVTATVVVALDHMLRGMFWSESVFGIVSASNWRWLEHAGWVVFEDVVLVMASIQSRREMASLARRRADELSEQLLRRAELTQKLEDRNALLSAMDEGAIIATTDGTGKITSANDNFCRISGYSLEELIGQDHRIVNSGYHPREFWTEMYQTIHSGRVWRSEVRNRAKGGSFYWVDTTIKGVLNAEGRVKKIIAVRADITDRKNGEIQLAQSQRLESIGQLAAGIAYEINTPVQYVSDNVRFMKTHFTGLLSIIKKYADHADPHAPALAWQERAADIEQTLKTLDFDFLKTEIPLAIEQSIEGLNRVAAIVRAMKEFSHPGSTSKEPADLNRSILSIAEVSRNRWKLAAEMETDLAVDLPPVMCFVAEFNQVILNLIVNAADALTEAAEKQTARKGLIKISTRVDGDAVEVCVQDNVPGIPANVQQRMLEQFFTTKPVGKGTGQGLSLSRNIINNKHGGSLDFTSDESGTTFVIRLPLSESAAQQIVA